MGWEAGILLFIQEFIRNEILTPIFLFITHLGDGGMIWIIACVLMLFFKKTRWVGVTGLLALLGSLLINNMLIKNLVARPRPFVRIEDLTILIPIPSEYSFPSGHTASSFAAAFVFLRHLPKKLGIPAIVLASLIGLSRMYIGVHYPTDILFGVLSGWLLSWLAEGIVRLVRKKTSVDKPNAQY